MDEKQKNNSDLLLESSLQAFFYDSLNEVNKKSLHPLPNEVIYYSSIVMARFAESKHYFQEEQGRVREKILGKKFLESSNLPKNKQIEELKDIGDTALFLCGYFSDSLNRKLLNMSYYQKIGQLSYRKLNVLLPIILDFTNFYNFIAQSFIALITVIGIVAKKFFSQTEDDFTLLVSNAMKLKAS